MTKIYLVILVQYNSYSDIINARIVYEWPDKKLVGNGVLIKFTDQQIVLTQSQKIQYNKIQNLITSLPSSNEDQISIKKFLSSMAENTRIGQSQTEQIINLRVFLENTKAWLSEEQLLSITTLLQEFETSDTIALNGGNIVDQARQALIDLAPSDDMKSQVTAVFDVIKNIAEPWSQPEILKTEIIKIIKLFSDNAVWPLELQNKWNEDKIDRSYIELEVIPRTCAVLWFYNVPSEQCPDASWVSPQVVDSSPSSWWFGVILKRVGIVVGILWWIFLLIVIFFAVKAKIQQNQEDKEEEEDQQ